MSKADEYVLCRLCMLRVPLVRDEQEPSIAVCPWCGNRFRAPEEDWEYGAYWDEQRAGE